MSLTYFSFSKQNAALAVKEQKTQTQAPVMPQQPAAPAGSKSKDIPN